MDDDAPVQQPQKDPKEPSAPTEPQDPDPVNDAKRRRPSNSDSQPKSQPDENNDPGEEYKPLKRRRKIEPRGVPWFVMLERLKNYKERYGSLNVPSTFRKDPKLASWVQYQRYLYHHKEIADERKAALDELGFEWSILKPKSGGKKRTWDEQLALVKAYKEENGHSLIPYSYQADPSLGFWVSKQRKDFKHGQLAEDKVAKLDAIGFTWTPPTGRRQGSKKKKAEEPDAGSNRQSSWEKMFEKLKEFQAVHGSERAHSRSDLNAIDRTLATWIKTQRHMYTIKKMSPERIAKLEAIGFAWRVGQDWKDFFARLKDYRDKHGTCDFPANEDPRLSAWVDSQRVSFKYRELSKERVDKLKSIGFSFEIDEGLEALEASAPPVDDDGLAGSMAPLPAPKKGNGARKGAKGGAPTKLSEYNIAMHLAQLADKTKAEEERTANGQDPAIKSPGEKEGVAKVVLVDGMDGTNDVGRTGKEATKGPTKVDDEEDELLKLQEEICELQAEKVRLQEEQVLVQQEKLWLHQEIASLQARNSELKQQKTTDAAKDKEGIASKETEASGEDNTKEITELQSKADANEEQLSKQTTRIQQQAEKLEKLEKELSEME